KNIVQDVQDRQALETAGWKVVLDDLHLRLSSRGHSETVTKFYEQAAVHFAFWTVKRQIHRSQITDEHIGQFLSRHLPICRCKIGGVRKLNLVHAGLWHVKVVLDAGGYRP